MTLTLSTVFGYTLTITVKLLMIPTIKSHNGHIQAKDGLINQMPQQSA